LKQSNQFVPSKLPGLIPNKLRKEQDALLDEKGFLRLSQELASNLFLFPFRISQARVLPHFLSEFDLFSRVNPRYSKPEVEIFDQNDVCIVFKTKIVLSVLYQKGKTMIIR
jgi:hypothetical protein